MNGGWQDRDRRGGNGERSMLSIGILLVLLGVFFLVSEQMNFDFNRYGWPMFVIVPGLLLLAVGLAISHEGGLGAAIPGGIITMTGLILAFQDATGAYASWAYAWALVAPGSVGLSMALWALLHRRWDLFDAGIKSLATGLGLFVGFGLLFENIMGLDNSQSTVALRDALPIMAVGLGVLIVLWNLLPSGWRGRSSNRWTPPAPPMPPAPPAS
jgi:hypothetical protein